MVVVVVVVDISEVSFYSFNYQIYTIVLDISYSQFSLQEEELVVVPAVMPPWDILIFTFSSLFSEIINACYSYFFNTYIQ